MAGAGSAIRYGSTLALALALAIATGFGAAAAQQARLHQGSGTVAAPRRAPQPLVGRYEYDGGGFILDRSTANRVVLRFDGNPEIWVLIPSSGPRGDIIYRTDS